MQRSTALKGIPMHIRHVARLGALAAGAVLWTASAALAGEYNLTVDRVTIDTGDFTRSVLATTGLRQGRCYVSRKVRR